MVKSGLEYFILKFTEPLQTISNSMSKLTWNECKNTLLSFFCCWFQVSMSSNSNDLKIFLPKNKEWYVRIKSNQSTQFYHHLKTRMNSILAWLFHKTFNEVKESPSELMSIQSELSFLLYHFCCILWVLNSLEIWTSKIGAEKRAGRRKCRYVAGGESTVFRVA